VSLPLLAALPNAFYLEYMPWFEPLYGKTLMLNQAGQAVVPTAPGWGASFDRAAIARREVP
jgi:L-alanine-DL-glutamate epimerase-like enolase superfamily enzyme